MGADLTAFGNHNLNTKSVTALAMDRFNRMDINIEYGFYGFKKYFKLLSEDKEDQFILLGKLIKDEKYPTF